MAYSIGEVGSRLGIATSAIRYYEKAGLVRPAGRRSGRRVYDRDAVEEIAFVARARSAGLGVSEIRQLTDLFGTLDPAGERCRKARQFAKRKIVDIDRQIAAAQALRAQLVLAADADCSGMDRCAVVSR